MHARHKKLNLDPGRVQDAAANFETAFVGRYQSKSGNKGVTLLGNSATGEAKLISVWADQSKMNAGRVLDREASDDLHDKGGGQGQVSEDEWDVVVHKCHP